MSGITTEDCSLIQPKGFPLDLGSGTTKKRLSFDTAYKVVLGGSVTKEVCSLILPKEVFSRGNHQKRGLSFDSPCGGVAKLFKNSSGALCRD